MTDVTLEQAIENASAYKQIGTEEVFLWNAPYPWEYADEIKSGGTRHHEMTIWVTAVHPCGLRFLWSVGLETPDAFGKGHVEVDVATIAATRLSLGDTDVRIQYEEYLNECADAIEKRALIDQDHINRELNAVVLIREGVRSKE